MLSLEFKLEACKAMARDLTASNKDLQKHAVDCMQAHFDESLPENEYLYWHRLQAEFEALRN